MGGNVGRGCKTLGGGGEERVLLCGGVESEEEVEGVRIGLFETTFYHGVVGFLTQVKGGNGGVQRQGRSVGVNGFEKGGEGGGE